MKINVFGFKFDKEKLPKAMKATDVFVYMSEKAGLPIGKLYKYGTQKIQVTHEGKQSEWWGGMVIKFRDSQAFTKLTEKDGKAILTAETLAANEKLVELTYFVASAETGNGLFARHYHGTSLMAFAISCRKAFMLARARALELALKDKSNAEKSEIRALHHGFLELEQLTNDTNLKDLVKKLKRVSSFELKLATLETKEKFLLGVIEKASRQTLKLSFPPDEDVDDLADDADEIAGEAAVKEIKVTGYDAENRKKEFFKTKNPLTFDQFDYDDIMKGLVIDMSDWAGSIAKSEMIKQLLETAHTKSTLKLMTTA